MPTPQLRHFAKDLLQLVLPSEMQLLASRECQVDDLKKALRLELASLVLSFLRHLDLTDITVGNRPFLLSVPIIQD